MSNEPQVVSLEALAMAQEILEEHAENLETTGKEDPAVDNNQGDGATLGRIASRRYRDLLALARLVIGTPNR